MPKAMGCRTSVAGLAPVEASSPRPRAMRRRPENPIRSLLDAARAGMIRRFDHFSFQEGHP